MSEGNHVIRKGNIVVKTFASHLNYLRENSIYEKLEGSDLAPRVLYAGSDSIEHEYIEGETLSELLEKNSRDAAKIAELFRLFFEWYAAFRAKTGNCIENISFSKFIYSGGKLRCVDFEHCKADFAEKDVASLAAGICVSGKPFSFRSAELCRLFICVGAGIMSFDHIRLRKMLTEALSALYEDKDAAFEDWIRGYLLNGITTCGLLFAENPLADTSSALSYLSTLPQRIVISRDPQRPECPSFERFTSNGPSDGLRTLSKVLPLVKQPQCLLLNASAVYPWESIKKLLSYVDDGADAYIAAEEGSGRIYPMLARTDTLNAAVRKAIASGASDLRQAAALLNVKYL